MLNKSHVFRFCLCFLLIFASIACAIPAAAISKQSIGLVQTATNNVTVICEPVSGATHYEVVYSKSKTMDTYTRTTFTSNECEIKSLTVMPLKRTGCWNAKLMPRRARSVIDRSVMSSPSKRICPDVG